MQKYFIEYHFFLITNIISRQREAFLHFPTTSDNVHSLGSNWPFRYQLVSSSLKLWPSQSVDTASVDACFLVQCLLSVNEYCILGFDFCSGVKRHRPGSVPRICSRHILLRATRKPFAVMQLVYNGNFFSSLAPRADKKGSLHGGREEGKKKVQIE